jgi:hypothetical protein
MLRRADLFREVLSVWCQRVREEIMGKDIAGEQHHHTYQCPTMHCIVYEVGNKY